MLLLYLYNAFIFSGLTHYIYCSTLISTIVLRALINLLFTVIVIIVILVGVVVVAYLFIFFIIIITITILVLFVYFI